MNFTGDSRRAFPEMFVNALAELCLEGSDEIVLEILKVNSEIGFSAVYFIRLIFSGHFEVFLSTDVDAGSIRSDENNYGEVKIN